MTNAVMSHREQTKSTALPGIEWWLTAVLGMWLILVFALGAGEMLVAPPGRLPLPILLASSVPIGVFLAAFWLWPEFHARALAVDLRLLTGIQAWRFAGFGFLALYTYGVLPGFFAWPAGLGDMAISLSAPWMLAALIRQPNFAASKGFVVWNILGILDLVVAIGSGVLGSRFAADVVAAVTTGPMAHLPLVLIPAYLVPVFIMLHLAALFRARHLAVTTRG
jgi:hypothetical protein